MKMAKLEIAQVNTLITSGEYYFHGSPSPGLNVLRPGRSDGKVYATDNFEMAINRAVQKKHGKLYHVFMLNMFGSYFLSNTIQNRESEKILNSVVTVYLLKKAEFVKTAHRFLVNRLTFGFINNVATEYFSSDEVHPVYRLEFRLSMLHAEVIKAKKITMLNSFLNIRKVCLEAPRLNGVVRCEKYS